MVQQWNIFELYILPLSIFFSNWSLSYFTTSFITLTLHKHGDRRYSGQQSAEGEVSPVESIYRKQQIHAFPFFNPWEIAMLLCGTARDVHVAVLGWTIEFESSLLYVVVFTENVHPLRHQRPVSDIQDLLNVVIKGVTRRIKLSFRPFIFYNIGCTVIALRWYFNKDLKLPFIFASPFWKISKRLKQLLRRSVSDRKSLVYKY